MYVPIINCYFILYYLINIHIVYTHRNYNLFHKYPNVWYDDSIIQIYLFTMYSVNNNEEPIRYVTLFTQ